MATDSDGDAVIVWASVQDGYSTGVFGRRYSSSGSAVASEFQVNAYTYLVQNLADVGIDAAGNFVVVWISERYWPFTLTRSVFGQRYASSGAAIGGEFQINASTSTEQLSPSVAVEADGDFVVVWKTGTSRIFGRRYASDGATVGSEFQVSTHPGSTKFDPQVAVQSAGDFVVAWTSDTQDGSIFFPGGVFAQHLSSVGTPVGSEFKVNTFTVNSQNVGGIAAGGDGRFVITWTDGALDGSASGIIGQRFVTPCPVAPASGCRTAMKSLLSLKNNSDDQRDKLIFKWLRGQSTSDLEFGSPDLTRTYRLCVYDANGSLLKADVPPDAMKWDDLQYKDSSGTADGIQRIILKSSDAGRAKVIVKGRGGNLPDPTLGSLPVPITVQLLNDETSLCFESVFGADDILINDAEKLKARF